MSTRGTQILLQKMIQQTIFQQEIPAPYLLQEIHFKGFIHSSEKLIVDHFLWAENQLQD